MALTWEEMNKIIDAKGPELLKKLCAVLEPTILAEFVQTGVLLDWQKLELGDMSSRMARANRFVELLKSGSVENFTKFLGVMRKNNQRDIADMLMPETGQSSQVAAGTSHVAGVRASPKGSSEELPDDLDAFFRANLETFKKLYLDANLLMDLFSKEVITRAMRERYDMPNKTESEKVSMLLMDHLPKRDRHNKVMFLKCILMAEQKNILEEIGLTEAQINYIKNFK